MWSLPGLHKAEADRTGDAFQRGRSHGLYEVVSLMVQQAEAFDRDRREVGLAGIEPASSARVPITHRDARSAAEART